MVTVRRSSPPGGSVKPVDHRRQTTLITGASSGIGAEFARQLAARGTDVVLVARRANRLDDLAAELQARRGVKAVPIVADLTSDSPGAALQAETSDRGLTITSVVNNAGFGSWGLFRDDDPARLRAMIALNISALTDISRAFLPQLQAFGTGYLLNIASVAAYASIPMQAAYSATKAYVLSLTESIWAESRGTGLRVMSFAPGVTRTEYFDVVGTTDATGGSPFQTPERVVSNALKALERRNPPPSAVSGLMNHAIAVSNGLLPRRWAVLAARANTMRNKGVR
jgi:uncharacterized protein